ncbi:MAG: hypothetical protein LBL98_07330 [Ruminococcus sp.]|jgi:flagellar biosynthesis/type III secretory pathway protein FliH|nr:hypothetical protein [Ruminococcus sp.]
MESLTGVTESERDCNTYLSRLKYEMLRSDEIQMAKEKAYAETFTKAYAESFAKAYAESFAEAYAESKAETLIEIAKRMIKLGYAPEMIAKGVDLPLSEIESLRD